MREIFMLLRTLGYAVLVFMVALATVAAVLAIIPWIWRGVAF
jgi:hypothetical protein